jgi:hypothetical protein
MFGLSLDLLAALRILRGEQESTATLPSHVAALGRGIQGVIEALRATMPLVSTRPSPHKSQTLGVGSSFASLTSLASAGVRR